MSFCITTIRNISDILDLSKALTLFAFRGQADADWDLTTSLERAFSRSGQTIYSLENTEHWMLHDFQAKFYLYSNSVPRQTNKFEWLALMQHHGGATRLLDFTHSIYVAAYFATAAARADSAIWAINRPMLRDNLQLHANLPFEHGKDLKDVVNERIIEAFNNFVARPHHSSNDKNLKHLVPLESQSLFDRASRQKSLFIGAGYLGEIGAPFSYMDNFCASFDGMADALKEQRHTPVEDFPRHISFRKEYAAIKIIVPRALHSQMRKELELMGLSEESLFPGLDGLARSLIHTHIAG